jgi:hypothetical protein
MPINWKPVVGRWRVSENNLTYSGPERPEWEFGICKSNIKILDGWISTDIYLTKITKHPQPAARVILDFQSTELEYHSVGLGGDGFANQINRFRKSEGWRPILHYGIQSDLKKKQNVVINIIGQRILMTVDGAPIFDHTLEAPLPSSQTTRLALFAWGANRIEFQNITFNKKLGQAL